MATSERCPPSIEGMSPYELSTLAKKMKLVEDSLPEASVKTISFGLLAERLNNVGVVDITAPKGNKNLHGTVNDPKMGVMDTNTVCETCQKSSLMCSGHLGIISIGSPILNYICIDDLPKLLSCVCWNLECPGGGSLLDPSHLVELGLNKYHGKSRLDAIANIVGSTQSCHACYSVTPEIKKESNLPPTYKAKTTKDNEWILTPNDMVNILDRIKNADAEFLGFIPELSHPRNFVTDLFPIMPICARPPVYVGGQITDDDITGKYNELYGRVKAFLIDPSAREPNYADLFKIISQIIDNKEKAVKHTKELIPCIKKRIDGKKGIVRNAMMGKRKDFTSRTVIITDSSLRFGEIGIPSDIASEMPVSIRVTRYNLEYVKSLFGNSLAECKVMTVIPEIGATKDYPYIVNEKKWAFFKKNIGVGCTIQRPLETGDYVFGGRQPTIAAASLMGFRAVIVPGKCFRLHMSYTTCLNADFDGDEMHFHYPQSIGCQIEVRTIMNCTFRIIDPNSNGPNYGIVYNGLTSGYLLTRGYTFTLEEWDKGYSISGERFGKRGTPTFNKFVERLRSAGVDELSGRALFSSLFPEDFYYDRYNHQKKEGFLIRNGILISGIVTKTFNGRARSSILQSLYHQYGRGECVEYLTRCVWLLDWFISIRGLSVSLRECYTTDEQHSTIKNAVNVEIIEANNKTKLILQKDRLIGERNKLSSTFEEDFKEQQIYQYVKKIETAANEIFLGKEGKEGYLRKNNPLYEMMKSGAKGSEGNITQISSIVGQQLIYNKRPSKNLDNGRRACTYFEPNDDSALARGFIRNSYLDGMDPSELYFHCLAARVGLLETGIGTSVTGAMQRKMTKVAESQMINSQGFVSNTSGNIFSVSLLSNLDPNKLISILNVEEKTGLCSFINYSEVCGKLSQ